MNLDLVPLDAFYERLLEQSFIVVLLVVAVLFLWRRCNSLQRANERLQASLVQSIKENTSMQLRWADKLFETQSSIVMKLAHAFSMGPKPKLHDLVELIEDDFQLKLSANEFEGRVTQQLFPKAPNDSEPPLSG